MIIMHFLDVKSIRIKKKLCFTIRYEKKKQLYISILNLYYERRVNVWYIYIQDHHDWLNIDETSEPP